ncbi:hypothetical protein NEF87_002966 [Candidatus Lokiarchaeum ossiferum]|uniref:STAS/SEC14 domain-containing protein n=1 Tax=Candidatus Lokiarchaeum ossiferum TaxID=2951803 RepID=A0ABY6HVS3_9ARCH|nr:hypothetical protein NEF87_002966 [Candidatus Lokiarchaeum sp. B-35]
MSWINYKNKKLLFIDLRNKKEEEVIKLAGDAKDILINSGKTDNLRIINVEGAFGNKAIMNELKRIGKITKPYYTKTAIIGVTGMKSILLKAYNSVVKSNTKSFETEEKAKKWLVSEK